MRVDVRKQPRLAEIDHRCQRGHMLLLRTCSVETYGYEEASLLFTGTSSNRSSQHKIVGPKLIVDARASSRFERPRERDIRVEERHVQEFLRRNDRDRFVFVLDCLC